MIYSTRMEMVDKSLKNIMKSRKKRGESINSNSRSFRIVKSKAEQTEKEILKMIHSGDLSSGQWLKQQELARLLNTSITPLREALRRLEVAGVVTNVPFKGVRVCEVSTDLIKEVYLVHSLLQSEAVRLYIPKITNREIINALNINEKIKECIKQKKFGKIQDLNQKMHLILCGVPKQFSFIGKLIESLWRQFPQDLFVVVPNRAVTSSKEHDEILNAISKGDSELAAKYVKNHYLSVGRSIVAHMDPLSGELFLNIN